jgi:Zn2+/Cd2+-exporting ATPase
MQVTSLLSRQDPDCADCGHDHGGLDHSHTNVKLRQALAGLILALNAFLLKAISPSLEPIGDLSALVGAVILGWPIMKVAYIDLRRGLLGINELVALGVLASACSGDFRTSAIVAFFMLLGEIIETRTAVGARNSIESLIRITPTLARRLVGGREEEVQASALAVGDVIRIRPGDSIPADGVIATGQASINQANITGESLPVDKAPGDTVFAGTINLTGALEVKVTKAGQDTTLGRVRELILAAEKTKLPFMRIIDQYIHYYTPMVLVIAALVWGFTHDLERVISVLVVACPCAFILATPSAMVAAIAAAARLGILVKNIADLEAAARITAFVFDKTGTLTTGRLAVSRLQPLDDVSPAELLRLTASVEQFSNHPTAKAIVQLAQEASVPLGSPTDFKETAGRGVSANIEGRRIVIGRAAWLRDNGVAGDFVKTVDLDETAGFSLLYAAADGRCIGWIGLQDQVRAEAAEAIRGLGEAGIQRIAMVSGDRKPVAERVSKEVGIVEFVAECLPQDKVEFVKVCKANRYRVAVVGDGVNDAPALAAGDISIAMGAAGSEVAIHSATIALMNNDLRRLPFLVKLSRLTRSVINQNFMFGVLFIIGGLASAAAGWLNPIVAAAMHTVGSLIVVFNSARLVRQGEEMDPHAAIAPAEGPSSGSNPASGAIAAQPA